MSIIKAYIENTMTSSEKKLFFAKYPWLQVVTNDINDIPKDANGVFVDISEMIDGNTYDRFIENMILAVKDMKEHFKNNILFIFDVSVFEATGSKVHDIKESNPVAFIYRYMRTKEKEFKKNFSNCTFMFENDEGYFNVTADKYTNAKYVSNMDKLLTDMSKKRIYIAKALTGVDAETNSDDINEKRSKGISSYNKRNIIKTNNDQDKKINKEKLGKEITDTTKNSNSIEDALEQLDNNDNAAEMAQQVAEDEGGVRYSAARNSRFIKVNDEFMKRKYGKKTYQQVIDDITPKDLPSTSLKIDTVNDEWKDLKFVNFEKVYDINTDIIKILNSFSEKENYPVNIRDIKVEDTSNSQDYIETYTVECEDKSGKRFKLTFDVPKFINNRVMKLRGNKKITAGQLLLVPCSKSDSDTVQVVSNYNKIFIRRYGFTGKSFAISDRIIKTLKKMQSSPGFEIKTGDNSKSAILNQAPMDFIDISSEITSIDTDRFKFIFDPKSREFDSATDKSKLPFGLDKKNKKIMYFDKNVGDAFSSYLISFINEVLEDTSIPDNRKNGIKEFRSIFDKTKPANRLMYSKASIMSHEIPLIVIIGYHIGLKKSLANIMGKETTDEKKGVYKFAINLNGFNPEKQDYIKFKDYYLIYDLGYANSLLMNGLKDCDTANYTKAEAESKSMWLDFLDEFGGRILGDGLDNFYDLFMDPITMEVCKNYNMPDDYIDILIYGSNLLADSQYTKHTDISGNRYRTTEIVAGYVYKALSKAYAEYRTLTKKGRNVGMSLKRAAVIDAVLADSMTSDLSILNPLLEIESANTVSFKGLSGMNTDRAYSLDKRTYDDSMINKLALSTGFAANVGIARQTTIDMDIEGSRGYIKNNQKAKDMNITKTFGMTEALTPFGTTRDDPFRSAMTFIQTSKHSMRTEKSMPLLITNGADEALAHMVSDTFAFKAKEDGTIIEKTDEYMIIEYKSGEKEFVDLANIVEKNSDGGFFINLKLDTDLKEGSKAKAGDIIAYDKKSFSKVGGATDALAYNLGLLCKVAITSTDEGFEDSTIVSEWMSEALASDVVVETPISLAKNTNIYEMVKKGQLIQEGEPLIIFQNSFAEEDANALLRTVTGDESVVSDLGRIRVKSKVSGVIQDVRMYRTCELDDASPSVKKLFTGYEKYIKQKKALYKKHNISGATSLEADYKLPQSGKLKDVQDGIMIEFFIMYHDKFSIGDKNVAQSAAKGVAKDIFQKGKEPWSEYRPEETIHGLYSVASFNARMITSVLVSGAINKGMIELDRQVKEIMGIPIKYLEEIE